MLATAGFAEHYTADNTGERLVEVAPSLGVADCVVAVVHDEAANQVAALRSAQKIMVKRLAGQRESFVCAAHRASRLV